MLERVRAGPALRPCAQARVLRLLAPWLPDKSDANARRKLPSVAWPLPVPPAAETRLLKLCWSAETAELDGPAAGDPTLEGEVEDPAVEVESVELVVSSCPARLATAETP